MRLESDANRVVDTFCCLSIDVNAYCHIIVAIIVIAKRKTYFKFIKIEKSEKKDGIKNPFFPKWR